MRLGLSFLCVAACLASCSGGKTPTSDFAARAAAIHAGETSDELTSALGTPTRKDEHLTHDQWEFDAPDGSSTVSVRIESGKVTKVDVIKKGASLPGQP